MRSKLTRVLRKYGIFLGFVAIVVALSVLAPAFLTSANLWNIGRQTSIHGIMAVGMTFVILTGGIDLSIGSVLAVTGILCAYLLHANQSIWVVVPATLLLGGGIGLFSGLVITKGKVAPFVVTLGAMSIARGVAHIFTAGQPISGFSESFRFVGKGEVCGVPAPIILFLLTVAAAAVVLKHTRLGRYTYAIGGNVAAARLSGINVSLYTTLAYVICGLTAAISAIVLTARLNSAESIAGEGYELDVIAAVVVGGTSLMGGRGSVWGTLLGTLLIGTINNGMNLLLISSYYQLVVKGVIIVAAVLLDRLRED